jgi:hypothetical protein
MPVAARPGGTRPATAPACYRARPASVWINAVTRPARAAR